jgi:hypothetical protein
VATTSVPEDIVVSAERRTWFRHDCVKDTDESRGRLNLGPWTRQGVLREWHLPSTANWCCEPADEVEWVLPEKLLQGGQGSPFVKGGSLKS